MVNHPWMSRYLELRKVVDEVRCHIEYDTIHCSLIYVRSLVEYIDMLEMECIALGIQKKPIRKTKLKSRKAKK